MTKYQVRFEPWVSGSFGQYVLYRSKVEDVWEYVRDFPTLERVDAYILAAVEGFPVRVIREFEAR